jgi:hypothetical protein
MPGRPQEAAKPLIKAMTVVLTNGASLRMLTPALKTKPFIAAQVGRLFRLELPTMCRYGRIRLRLTVVLSYEYSLHTARKHGFISIESLSYAYPAVPLEKPSTYPTMTIVRSCLLRPQDLFQHNTWSVKVKGVGPQEDESKKQVDFSDFYKKFGLGE